MSAGKLDCYVAAAGFSPTRVLPVVIDVGTDNEGLRNDPLYTGLRQERICGQEYFEVSFSHRLKQHFNLAGVVISAQSIQAPSCVMLACLKLHARYNTH